MSNHLSNGSVLPHGLLGNGGESSEGFRKTYNNTAIRVGVIVACYPITDESNRTKLAPEYDVVAIEQNEGQGATTTLYRNCLSLQGMGGIADFFEKTLRPRETKKYKGDATRMDQQNGNVVMLLCLDGASEKALIVGGFPHPDRKTTLVDDQPHMEGEYNGVNMKVESDGSTTVTWKGATDNDGKVIDDQGATTLKVEKDGSYEVNHKTITQRFDKNGKASLTADDNISNTTQKDFNVTADGAVNTTSSGNTVQNMADWTVTASGSATLGMSKLSIVSSGEIKVTGSTFALEASTMARIKSTQITLDGLVSLGGDGGAPVLTLGTLFIGIGNLGIPVMSTAIAGYAQKVQAQ